jgi:hypothetical protein
MVRSKVEDSTVSMTKVWSPKMIVSSIRRLASRDRSKTAKSMLWRGWR